MSHRHKKPGPIRKTAETLLGGAAGIGVVTAVATALHAGAAPATQADARPSAPGGPTATGRQDPQPPTPVATSTLTGAPSSVDANGAGAPGGSGNAIVSTDFTQVSHKVDAVPAPPRATSPSPAGTLHAIPISDAGWLVAPAPSVTGPVAGSATHSRPVPRTRLATPPPLGDSPSAGSAVQPAATAAVHGLETAGPATAAPGGGSGGVNGGLVGGLLGTVGGIVDGLLGGGAKP